MATYTYETLVRNSIEDFLDASNVEWRADGTLNLNGSDFAEPTDLADWLWDEDYVTGNGVMGYCTSVVTEAMVQNVSDCWDEVVTALKEFGAQPDFADFSTFQDFVAYCDVVARCYALNGAVSAWWSTNMPRTE